jgi:hypothetical protein
MNSWSSTEAQKVAQALLEGGRIDVSIWAQGRVSIFHASFQEPGLVVDLQTFVEQVKDALAEGLKPSADEG